VQLFAQEFKEHYHLSNLVGRSQAIRDVFTRIVKIAPTDATALITGESGTGKELVARAIHANSKRARRPFVTVNCAAISETLLESELFGYVRGAFTGAVTTRKGLIEEANGGTFFFDEIAETTPAFQAKLLRAIQEGEIRRLGENRPLHVDFRVVAATNVDLKQAIAERRFREDLYYRLNVARFVLPPLRERLEDVPLLVACFLEKYAKKTGRRAHLADGVMEHLLACEYPGNIRELENMIEQAVALCSGGCITLDDLFENVPNRPGRTRAGMTLEAIVRDAERRGLEQALVACENNRERAAERLNVSVTTLWRKMNRLGLGSRREAQPSLASNGADTLRTHASGREARGVSRHGSPPSANVP
jgi:two-component system response regulator HydG